MEIKMKEASELHVACNVLMWMLKRESLQEILMIEIKRLINTMRQLGYLRNEVHCASQLPSCITHRVQSTEQLE